MRVAFAVAAAMSLAGCGWVTELGGGSAVSPRLAAYLPSDAVTVACLRLERLRPSRHYARFLQKAPPEVKQVEAQADEILVAMDGKGTLILAKGKFDRARFAGLPVEFLEDGIVAAGDEPIRLRAKQKQGSALPPYAPKEAGFWVVTRGLPPVEFPSKGPMANLANIERLMEKLEIGTLGIELSSDIRMAATADLADEKAGEQMQTVLRGFLGMGRLATPDHKKELLKVFDAVKVEREKARVSVTAAWSAELVDEVISWLPESRRRD
jgi:hypothetical protein